jgi:hypothetical protein
VRGRVRRAMIGLAGLKFVIWFPCI